MNQIRRKGLGAAGGAGLYSSLVALGLIPAASAHAQTINPGAFQTKTLADTLKALGAVNTLDSKDVLINSPDIAENGAVVPVGVRSNLPKTEQISLMIEKNPNMLCGTYEILEGCEPDVSMRVKMGQSSDVIALVKADGKFYMTKKEIKVTLGGCGG
jgi:sulfur-oxidizing protein SoxY